MTQECYTAIVDDPPVQETHPYRDALIAVLIIAAFIAVFDIWKLLHHGKTISHGFQHLMGGKGWRILLGFLILNLIGWHLFIGFPEVTEWTGRKFF